MSKALRSVIIRRINETLIDSLYLFLTYFRNLRRTQRQYGYLRKIVKQATRNKGRVSFDQFPEEDRAYLKHVLPHYMQFRSSTGNIDIRIFNWLYLFALSYVMYLSYGAYWKTQCNAENCRSLVNQRAELSDDYIEDYRAPIIKMR